MDEKKGQDGLFHWNFDLKDSDTDFTDIDYSTEALPLLDETSDVKPLIFVDGNYKSDNKASFFEDIEEEAPSARKKAGTKKGAKSAAGVKGKKGYVDQKSSIPWKPILLGAAALAAVVLLLILILPKNQKKEWTVNENKDIETLINNYFEAKRTGDDMAMRRTLVPEALVDNSKLILESKLYESYSNIKIHSYPGMKKGEAALLTTYDSKFINIGTPYPTYDWFYVKPDGSNNLHLMTLTEMKSTGNEAVYDYFKNAYHESPEMTKLVEKIDKDYISALESDPALKAYIAQLESGKYLPPTKTPETTADVTGTAGTTAATAATEPASTAPTQATTQPISADTGNEKSVDYCAYVSDDGVRLRSTPTTGSNDNIVLTFGKGHYLQIVGELDGWYRVIDKLSSNGVGGTQAPSGQTGYVAADFIVTTYSQIGN